MLPIPENQSVARNITIEIDRNEQHPFIFPEQVVWSPRPRRYEMLRIGTERKVLPFGDYRLKKAPKGCVIERKMGAKELAHNLLAPVDRQRFQAAWTRFVEGCSFPVLVIEDSLARFHETPSRTKIRSEDVALSFWSLIQKQPPHCVIWAGRLSSTAHRIAFGTQLVRLLMHTT